MALSQPASTSSAGRARRELRRLAAIEAPYSVAVYLGARLFSGSISEPGGILYLLAVTAIALLGTLALALNALAAIVSVERKATTLLAVASILILSGGSAATAATFTAPSIPAKTLAALVAASSMLLLAYNNVKAIELLAERRQPEHIPTRPW